jgi:hypothetical protein
MNRLCPFNLVIDPSSDFFKLVSNVVLALFNLIVSELTKSIQSREVSINNCIFVVINEIVNYFLCAVGVSDNLVDKSVSSDLSFFLRVVDEVAKLVLGSLKLILEIFNCFIKLVT